MARVTLQCVVSTKIIAIVIVTRYTIFNSYMFLGLGLGLR